MHLPVWYRAIQTIFIALAFPALLGALTSHFGKTWSVFRGFTIFLPSGILWAIVTWVYWRSPSLFTNFLCSVAPALGPWLTVKILPKAFFHVIKVHLVGVLTDSPSVRPRTSGFSGSRHAFGLFNLPYHLKGMVPLLGRWRRSGVRFRVEL
jgi:hypothetical protein